MYQHPSASATFVFTLRDAKSPIPIPDLPSPTWSQSLLSFRRAMNDINQSLCIVPVAQYSAQYDHGHPLSDVFFPIQALQSTPRSAPSLSKIPQNDIFHNRLNQDTIGSGYSRRGCPRICPCQYWHTSHSFGSRHVHVLITSPHFLHHDDWSLVKRRFPAIHKETGRTFLP